MKFAQALLVETDWCEYKSSLGGFPSDLWKTISSFSNTEGGKIFLGINKDGNAEKLSPEQLDKYQQEIVVLCKSGFFNETIWPEITILEDTTVVCIQIRPLPHGKRPVYSVSRGLPRGAFVRIGSSDVECDSEWIRRFSIWAQGGAENTPLTSVNIHQLDKGKIDKYRDLVNQMSPMAFGSITDEELLMKIGGIDSNKFFTLLGLLCFAKNNSLQEIYSPNCKVVFVQYRGTEKVNAREGKVIQLDDKEFTGDLSSQYNDVMGFLVKKLPLKSRLTGPILLRQDELAVPVAALREVVANAIAHRDYSDRGSYILIEMYDDRIEFHNSGRSLIPIEQLAKQQPQSRNPQLMAVLRDLKIVEHRGRGIQTIIAAMQQADLSEPEFKHNGNSFVVTLRTVHFLKGEILDWLEEVTTGKDLNDKQKKCLAYLKGNRNPWFGNEDYRNLNHLGMDQSLASREIRVLLEMGLLKRNDKKNRGAKYKLAPELL